MARKSVLSLAHVLVILFVSVSFFGCRNHSFTNVNVVGDDENLVFVGSLPDIPLFRHEKFNKHIDLGYYYTGCNGRHQWVGYINETQYVSLSFLQMKYIREKGLLPEEPERMECVGSSDVETEQAVSEAIAIIARKGKVSGKADAAARDRQDVAPGDDVDDVLDGTSDFFSDEGDTADEERKIASSEDDIPDHESDMSPAEEDIAYEEQGSISNDDGSVGSAQKGIESAFGYEFFLVSLFLVGVILSSARYFSKKRKRVVLYGRDAFNIPVQFRIYAVRALMREVDREARKPTFDVDAIAKRRFERKGGKNT